MSGLRFRSLPAYALSLWLLPLTFAQAYYFNYGLLASLDLLTYFSQDLINAITQLRDSRSAGNRASFFDQDKLYRMLVRKDMGYMPSVKKGSIALTEQPDKPDFDPGVLLVSPEQDALQRGDLFAYLTFTPPAKVKSQLVLSGLLTSTIVSEYSDSSAGSLGDEAGSYPRSGNARARMMFYVFRRPVDDAGSQHFQFLQYLPESVHPEGERVSPGSRSRRSGASRRQRSPDSGSSGYDSPGLDSGWLISSRVSAINSANLYSYFGEDFIKHVRHRQQYGNGIRQPRRSDYYEVQFQVLRQQPKSLFNIQRGMLTRVFESDGEYFQVSVPYTGSVQEPLLKVNPPGIGSGLFSGSPVQPGHDDGTLKKFLQAQERQADLEFINPAQSQSLPQRSTPISIVGGGQCAVVFTFPGKTDGLVFRRFAGLTAEEAERLIYTEQASLCFLEEIPRARDSKTRELLNPEEITMPPPGSIENTRLPSKYLRIPAPDGSTTVYEVQRHLDKDELLDTHIRAFLNAGPEQSRCVAARVRVRNEGGYTLYENLLLYDVVDLAFGELLDHMALVGDNLNDLRSLRGLPVGVGDDAKIDNLVLLLQREGGQRTGKQRLGGDYKAWLKNFDNYPPNLTIFDTRRALYQGSSLYKPISAQFSASGLQKQFVDRVQQLTGFRKKAIKVLASIYTKPNGPQHIQFFIDYINRWTVATQRNETPFELKEVKDYIQNSVYSHRAFRAYLACCRLSARIHPERCQLPNAYVPMNDEQAKWLEVMFNQYGLEIMVMTLMEEYDLLDEFLHWLVHDRQERPGQYLMGQLERIKKLSQTEQQWLRALFQEARQRNLPARDVRAAAGLVGDYWHDYRGRENFCPRGASHRCEHTHHFYRSRRGHQLAHSWYGNFFRLYRYGWNGNHHSKADTVLIDRLFQPLNPPATAYPAKDNSATGLVSQQPRAEPTQPLAAESITGLPAFQALYVSPAYSSLQSALTDMLGLDRFEFWSGLRRAMEDLAQIGKTAQNSGFARHKAYGLMAMALSWLQHDNPPQGRLVDNLAVLAAGLLDRPLLLMLARSDGTDQPHAGVWFDVTDQEQPNLPVRYQWVSAERVEEQLSKAVMSQDCPYILVRNPGATEAETRWHIAVPKGCPCNADWFYFKVDENVPYVFKRAVTEIYRDQRQKKINARRNKLYIEQVETFKRSEGLVYLEMPQDGHCLHHTLATWLRRHGKVLASGNELATILRQRLQTILESIRLHRASGYSDAYAGLTEAERNLVTLLGEQLLADMLDELALPEQVWLYNTDAWGDENLIQLTAVTFEVTIPFIYQWQFQASDQDDGAVMQMLMALPNGATTPLQPGITEGEFVTFAGFNERGSGHWDLLAHAQTTEEAFFSIPMEDQNDMQFEMEGLNPGPETEPMELNMVQEPTTPMGVFMIGTFISMQQFGRLSQ